MTASDLNWHEVNLGFKPKMLIVNIFYRTTSMTKPELSHTQSYSENFNQLDSRNFIITDTGFKYNMRLADYIRGYFLYAASGVNE